MAPELTETLSLLIPGLSLAVLSALQVLTMPSYSFVQGASPDHCDYLSASLHLELLNEDTKYACGWSTLAWVARPHWGPASHLCMFPYFIIF